MSMNSRGTQAEIGLPSREEIETLCVLYTIGQYGCPASGLATKLGLSQRLATAVADGMTPLITSGWVALNDERFSLTDAGRAHLNERLQRWAPAYAA